MTVGIFQRADLLQTYLFSLGNVFSCAVRLLFELSMEFS